MGRPRSELQQLLSVIPGVQKVYFQPPNSTRMVYPSIVYELDNESVQYADNGPHRRTARYTITVIDRDPDSGIPTYISQMEYSSFNRFFTVNDLNHTVYNLYF